MAMSRKTKDRRCRYLTMTIETAEADDHSACSLSALIDGRLLCREPPSQDAATVAASVPTTTMELVLVLGYTFQAHS